MVAVLNRRAYAAAAALVLSAVGCADAGRDDSPVVGGAGSTTAPGGPSAGTNGTDAGGRDSTTKPAPRPGGSAKPPGGGDPGGARDDTIRRVADDAPGAFAGVLLAPGAASKLVVDVLVQDGAVVDSAALSSLRSSLASLSGKPVEVRGPTLAKISGKEHSADEIRAAADEGRAQGDDTAVVHVLYLNGEYTDDGALGVTVRADTMAIFPDQLDRVTSPFVSRARIERAVITHELGHVLGLVDLYLDENRADPEHPGHSQNPRSVMYWAVESDLVGQVLGGPPPVDFDADDVSDLQKIRAGAAPG